MIHLDEKDLHLVKKILRFHLENGEKVFAFGSRVTGERLKKHSDLDLCVRGSSALSLHIPRGLKDFFSVSDLPIRVDICDWHAISPEFQNIIQTTCEEIEYR